MRAECGVEMKGRKRLMLVLGLNEPIRQLATAYSAHWYGHVLRIVWTLRLKVKGRKGW